MTLRALMEAANLPPAHHLVEEEGDAADHPGQKMVFGVWRDVDADGNVKPTKSPAPAAPKAPAKPKRPTFDAAKEAVLGALEKQGWAVAKGLKVPHATSPDGKTRYWFKAQAVHVTRLDDPMEDPDRRSKKHDFGNARSTWGADIRDVDPEDFDLLNRRSDLKVRIAMRDGKKPTPEDEAETKALNAEITAHLAKKKAAKEAAAAK